MAENKLKTFFQLAWQAPRLLRSLKIAATVGSMYNLINQGDVILAGDFANVNYIKLTLTYMTPFFVATYASVITEMKMREKDI